MSNGRAIAVLDANIIRLNDKKLAFDDRYYPFISEKMKLIVREPIEDLPAAFANATSVFDACSNVAADNRKKQNARGLRLACCDILFDKIFENCEFPPPFLKVAPLKSEPKVAYLDNRQSKEALTHFLCGLCDASAEPMHNFSNVAEAVYAQKCDLCVLPIENSSDGRLSSFYNLIAKYELFITAVTDVTNYDFSLRTRYALLAHCPTSHLNTETIGCKLLFELDSELTASEVLTAADFFNVDCVSIDCIPEAYRVGNSIGAFTLAGTRNSIIELLFWLYLRQMPYILQGIYDEIRNGE